MTAMRAVYLHGDLGQTFGEGPFHLAVDSVQEVGRALAINCKGFRQYVRNGAYRVVLGDSRKDQGVQIGPEHLSLRLGDTMPEIHIVPEIAGSGGRGSGKLILGVAMVGVGLAIAFNPAAAAAIGAASVEAGTGAAAAAGLGAELFAGVTAGNVALIGASLAAGGLTQMLAPTPGSTDAADRERAPDWTFDGAVNVQQQGHPIPLVYGRFEVGSLVVSSGLETETIKDAVGSTKEKPAIQSVTFTGQTTIVKSRGKGGVTVTADVFRVEGTLTSSDYVLVMEFYADGFGVEGSRIKTHEARIDPDKISLPHDVEVEKPDQATTTWEAYYVSRLEDSGSLQGFDTTGPRVKGGIVNAPDPNRNLFNRRRFGK